MSTGATIHSAQAHLRRDITVLAVDDEPEFVEITAEFLEREDDRLTVLTETDPRDAIDRLATEEISCVVSDYDMPGMNGIELLHSVREHDTELPFILFTGKGSEEIASDAISAGVSDYLQKSSGVEQYELLANRIDTAVDQYRTERELARERALFGKTQELADVGAWEWYPQHEQGYYSEKVLDIYGIDSRSEGTPRADIDEFYHTEDRATLKQAFDRAVDTGEAWDVEVRVVDATGQEKWVRTQGDPQFENGTCVRVRGTVQDITKRKERSQRLKRYQRIVEATGDAIYALDTEGYITLVNESQAEWANYTRDELIGRHASDFMPEEDVRRGEELIAEILSNPEKERGRFEMRATPPGGEERIYEDDVAVITDDDGRFLGSVGVIRDITARKERERTLEQLAQQANDIIDANSKEQIGQVAVEIAENALRSRLAGVHLLSADGQRLGTVAATSEVHEKFDSLPTYRRDGDDARSELVWEAFDDGERTYLEEIQPDERLATETPVRSAIIQPLGDHGVLIVSAAEPDAFDQTDLNFVELLSQTLTASLNRRERERELEQARERLRVLFDEAPDSIVIHDADGQTLDANRQTLDKLGYTREELLEKNVADYEVGITPETLQTDWEKLAVGETMMPEGVHERKDGSTFPVEVRVTKIEGDGEPQFIALARDISERKEREQELERKQEFLERTQEVAEIGGWEADLRANTLRWTDEVYRIHGLPLEFEPEIDDALGFYHPEDQDTIESAFQRLTATGESYDLELRVVTPEDEIRWVRTRGTPLYDNGEVVGARGTFQDITGRKQRERELQRKQEFLERTQEVADIGSWKFDMETDETEWTQEVYRIHGLDPESAADQTEQPGIEDVLEFYHPDDQDAMKTALSELQTAAEPYDLEVRMTGNGTERWVRARGEPQYADGELVGAVGTFQDITERKERERQMQKLNERFELAVEGAELGVWDWDMTTGEVTYNQQWAEMIGHSLAEIEQQFEAWENRVHPDDLDSVRAALNSHLDEEIDYYDAEYRMRTADGEWKWIRTLGKVVERHENGEPIRAVGIHVDIDRRKRRELRLQQFREAVEQTAQAVYITDGDGTIEYVNPAFEELTGYSEDEALGQTPSILSSGKQTEEFYEALWDTIETGEQWEGEITDQRASGDEIVLYQTISPITDEHGDPEKFVAVAQDITERKAYQETLEQAREELRQIIDLVPDPVFVKDRESRYLIANEATAEAYGATPDEIEGNVEEEVVPEGTDAEQFQRYDSEVIDTGEPRQIPEQELRTADGTRIFQTTKIPYRVPEQDETAVLGYARDVTELKEYERRLEKQRDNLEVLNQVVRHDIRNDLQLVVTYSETLQREVEGGETEYVDQILDAARNAVGITTTAKDVTEVMLQPSADQQPMAVRPILDEQIDDVRTNHEQAEIEVEGSIPTVSVRADEMLESVFRNLLSNAVQHNDSDSPQVTVSVSRGDERAQVRVADNGPGIPDEQKAMIFEQGEVGLDSEGTGLGLYLVETLVDRYGGDIRVEDNDPTGSVFVVELPLAEE